jgi:hypothetical protein
LPSALSSALNALAKKSAQSEMSASLLQPDIVTLSDQALGSIQFPVIQGSVIIPGSITESGQSGLNTISISPDNAASAKSLSFTAEGVTISIASNTVTQIGGYTISQPDIVMANDQPITSIQPQNAATSQKIVTSIPESTQSDFNAISATLENAAAAKKSSSTELEPTSALLNNVIEEIRQKPVDSAGQQYLNMMNISAMR